MRLVTFAPKKGAAPRVGLMHGGNRVIDLARAGGKPPFDPGDMISLIASGAKGLAWLRKAAAKAKEKETLQLGKVKLLAPIPRPRKNVFCVGWNYLEHFEEGAKARAPGVELPEAPGLLHQVADRGERAVRPDSDARGVTEKVDWEVELGRHHRRAAATTSRKPTP